MSNKNIIARVGNFEITKDGGADHDYLRIRSIDGCWSISHRDDSPMYGIWMGMCKDPEYHKGMEVIIVMSYILSQSLLDEGFVRDYFDAVDAMKARRVAAAPEPTEKEEDEAIKEVALMKEAKKNL